MQYATSREILTHEEIYTKITGIFKLEKLLYTRVKYAARGAFPVKLISVRSQSMAETFLDKTKPAPSSNICSFSRHIVFLHYGPYL
ncbi:hypothetical protein ANPL_02925 [Anaplasma platys]|uniref:Uncharacterized protein n=1 Tax=Anaplasma platys TaxID=949 RepID=A0A858PYI4_9RICK|nr:hypothetical protein ANPL_02925 [Anaplasma platys]